MKTFQLKLSTIKDVQDFVRIITSYAGEADLSSGRYVVDAKSIMGIFSLDLQKPITLSLGSDQGNVDELLNSLDSFLIK